MRSKGREESQARARAGWGIDARQGSARSSPWHADGSPRRARREGVPRGEAEKHRDQLGTGRGESTARGRRPDSTATTARQKTGEGRENREGREKERERN